MLKSFKLQAIDDPRHHQTSFELLSVIFHLTSLLAEKESTLGLTKPIIYLRTFFNLDDTLLVIRGSGNLINASCLDFTVKMKVLLEILKILPNAFNFVYYDFCNVQFVVFSI